MCGSFCGLFPGQRLLAAKLHLNSCLKPTAGHVRERYPQLCAFVLATAFSGTLFSLLSGSVSEGGDTGLSALPPSHLGKFIKFGDLLAFETAPGCFLGAEGCACANVSVPPRTRVLHLHTFTCACLFPPVVCICVRAGSPSPARIKCN